MLGFPSISVTFNPPNDVSLSEHPEKFEAIVAKEFDRGRYLGPYSRAELEYLIGPFQSSPLSLIPKPHKPQSLRLIQNLSYPRIPRNGFSSINSSIDSSLFPFTWGTFSATSLLICTLPPGSQAACRDIAEAFRTIPMHPSQWPGAVVRLSNDVDIYALDTCSMFGGSPSPGVHGHVADAGADLMRYTGIGPLVKWIDDHFFARILLVHLDDYNRRRRDAARRISGQRHIRGRLWYTGGNLPDDSVEEFAEDCAFPLRDLSAASPRSAEDAAFTYCFADIDMLSDRIGYVWGAEKDVPFQTVCPYTGFDWDIEKRTVSISLAKREKYIAAIAVFRLSRTHNLEDVRKLYGKLLHACAVVPRGRAYLTSLETALSLGHSRPHMQLTPPRETPSDLAWWSARLASAQLCTRPIPVPIAVFDLGAFSDASSGFGVGIILRGRWRAWRLVKGWNTQGRDIQWAEAVGFELLVRAIIASGPPGPHFKCFGDNTAVVEGWWKHSSHNSAVNRVFRRLHDELETSGFTAHTRYVQSADNPADGPSRGVYPPIEHLLPPIALPDDLAQFLRDFDAADSGCSTRPHSVCDRKQLSREERTRRSEYNSRFERAGDGLLHDENFWWDCSLPYADTAFSSSNGAGL